MSSLSIQGAVEVITTRHNQSRCGMEGMSVCREMEKNPETEFLPILQLTGWQSGQNHLPGINGSSELCLKKPIDTLELIIRVRALIEKKGLTDHWENRENREKLLMSLSQIEVENEDPGALIEKIQKRVEARRIEHLRSRLVALAAELERGSIVHRRPRRVTELNQLRDQAIMELRSQAGLEGTPETLPGPEADEWIEWAGGLKESENAECLQTLRNGFTRLDDFVANLEPKMWVAAGSATLGRSADPERSADGTHQETSAGNRIGASYAPASEWRN